MKILVINIAMIQFVILEQIKVKKQLKYITSMYRIIEIKVNITSMLLQMNLIYKGGIDMWR